MALMQRKHSFGASKRAYRLKIKEWGLMRHKPHRPRQGSPPARRSVTNDGSVSDTTLVGDPVSGNEKHVDSNLSTALRPDEERSKQIILNAICNGNEFEVETQLRKPESMACLNHPLGVGLESRDTHCSIGWGWAPKPLNILPDGCVLLQPNSQTLLDVASALPNTAVVQKLLQAGAISSVHSQGTQVSMSNAIRNGRVENVRALLESGVCKASGLRQCTWVPLRQAAFWLYPSIIQLLFDHDPLWSSHLSPVEYSVLQSFITSGADIHSRFTAFSCTSPSSETFSHQLLYHAPSHLTRLLIDHTNVRLGGNGCHILHELAGGSCPNGKGHPAETLRDIEVLLKRGADPNCLDKKGRTALTACLGLCPSIDVFDRVQLLLRGGADPEERDAKHFDPVLMAIKGFQDPLRFRLTETLLYSYPTTTGPLRGEHRFPVVNLPLHLCSNMRDVINRATFSVATTRILDAAVKQQTRGGVLRSDDILRVIRMREDAGLPKYEFDQAFVLELLSATIPAPLAPSVGIYTQALDVVPIGVTAAGHSWAFGQMTIR
ncbi:uncharacterized protein BDZ99DRAFT_452335 [Mytilinidion resinicola]|uniref:Clr5 domain-containing protein n=1 Tax=Mytilinidion resinicola TaxID=574789 RepID=A0A6A6Y7Z0_9PEZI|nr:uncharacterized protein BDZ99DRAFT_452335 [Mytilinidion resinicola]KAF2803927.1 hypothetical protein BDZ99DRAFT_452335 [Mytilinidion resinicola]